MAPADPHAPRAGDVSGTGTTRPPTITSLLRLAAAIPGRSEALVAVVNGLFGDTLEVRGADWATPMTIRAGGSVLPLDRRALADTFATELAEVEVHPRLCILVHGLMSTESIWRLPDEPSTTYGSRLADDRDLTTLSVRYNTGRHISTNGRELSRLLGQLVAAWPVPVREVNLIGHSMGGLVVRSACHYGQLQRTPGRRFPFGRRWTSRVRRVVLVGVPNTGAGLEAVVNSISAALWSLPVPAARLIGLGLDQRSSGIKDLRFGAIVDEDWLEHDPGIRERIFRHLPDRLRRAEHLIVTGSVTANPEHPLAKVIGDALVTEPSASGSSPDGELFRRATTRSFPGVTHNALAHHPDVYEAIADWW